VGARTLVGLPLSRQAEAAMFNEFRTFIKQGSAFDLAIGVIIGAAFGKIVNSLVNDIITPLLSLALGRVDFTNMFIPLAGQSGLALEDARKLGAVLAYGTFLNSVIEFVIVAFSIFVVVRQINRWKGPSPSA
jgi:large conductance mechanosensitive channel